MSSSEKTDTQYGHPRFQQLHEVDLPKLMAELKKVKEEIFADESITVAERVYKAMLQDRQYNKYVDLYIQIACDEVSREKKTKLEVLRKVIEEPDDWEAGDLLEAKY